MDSWFAGYGVKDGQAIRVFPAIGIAFVSGVEQFDGITEIVLREGVQSEQEIADRVIGRFAHHLFGPLDRLGALTRGDQLVDFDQFLHQFPIVFRSLHCHVRRCVPGRHRCGPIVDRQLLSCLSGRRSSRFGWPSRTDRCGAAKIEKA
ncbi:MAG: hypothetical protein HYY38_06155 [Rhodospirillales bacterium]|nr:hypothetical protein [Rhodospirillales bacterium]